MLSIILASIVLGGIALPAYAGDKEMKELPFSSQNYR